MEITKEQVLDIYGTTGNLYLHSKLEKWFPDAFKVNNKINKPYKTNSGILKYFISKTEAYGFDADGEWSNYSEYYRLDDEGHNKWQEATTEEWESVLIAEAKKRGYNNGNYECLYMPHLTEETDGKMFFEDGELLIGFGSKSNMIFKDGVWAEIIKTFSKEQAEKLLGGKII
jgi:hypothetical protein